jgi:hypothetical protein
MLAVGGGVVPIGRGVRELAFVIAVAAVGVVLAAAVALTPWYPGPGGSGTPVVKLVTPAGVAGRP